MPRSGSTLIDQILSRHSKALSVGESMIVPETVNRIAYEAKASGRGYRDCAGAQRAAFRDAYRRAGGGADLVVDKNLFNFQHCGLIADLDPGARFILALRDPGDIALSVFRKKFLAAHPWSNDLDDIAHMIACFEMLTDHWRRILGERLFVLEHETLIGDFEAEVRALLDFCGLNFERACLEFQDSVRAVFTQSSVQCVGRWRLYERHLAPFWRALEAHRARLRAKA